MSLSVEMTIFRSFISILILHVACLVHAQNDQSGFISIDCGIDKGDDYTSSTTGINYVSDDGFIESGENHKVKLSTNGLASYQTTLRSFPENERNCYILRPQQGKNNRYLIMARFLHGNYDSLGQNRHFDLYLGTDYWATINITDPSSEQTREIIHLTSSHNISVCLIKKGQGNPFISGLELRVLDMSMYEGQFETLFLVYRNSFQNKTVRYEDDMYDRIWYPLSTDANVNTVINSNVVSAGLSDDEKVPLTVVRNAAIAIDSTDNFFYKWSGDTADNLIIYIYIAEVEILKSNQTREFNIFLNGNYLFGPISPKTTITTLNNKTPYIGSSSNNIEFNQTQNSNLPPIYNAIEIYTGKQLLQNQTEERDAFAIGNTKSTYGLKRNWQGDPCFPQEFLWNGLNCGYKNPKAARIISLNLSSSGLSGEIVTALANLTMIESLDLSYNNLTGTVPQFLASLDNLKLLKLAGNNFTRPLPAELLEKSKKRLLFLSIEEKGDQDKGYCLNGSCKDRERTNVVIPVIVAIATLIMLSTAFAIWMIIKRKKPKDMSTKEGSFKPSNQHYTYSEVRSITNNFKTVIGKGGFGTVFRGSIQDNQVAVKILSESSSQGYKEFQAEVKLLMDIRHKNITSLVGYCNDSNHKAIIYEYMVNGNLEQHLFDENSNVLSWVRRLQIGCDAAEGLVYMHHGCRPPVVHRDVKSSNILLDEGFRAKLADFGLSRACTTEDTTYAASTVVAGTCGYLDPEYYTTRRLTEKSDVYSFGVVLLELITSRPAISQNINIISWVKSRIEEGSVEDIIDPRLRGIFNIDNAWKVVELAIECVSNTAIKRPAMNDVAMDLKHCLQAEKTPQRIKSSNQSGYVPLNLEFVNDPDPR